MKKILLFITVFLLGMTAAFAQRIVSGVIVSDADNSPLPGVAVQVKGTTSGTVTDIDGKYSLSVPEDADILVFSFIGFASQEVAVAGRAIIDLSMAEDAEELEEVVVTALGITREKASLGYAVATVGSADVASRPEADIGRILRGKLPGVDISSVSGLAGTGTNIIIRGYSSISGTNQPLFVIDGVPFNTDANSDRGFAQGSATASSRFLDLDPNNIAEISVLKGLSATVLYGEAGRNGVILVTTKNSTAASSSKKFEITLTQSGFANQAASVPTTQDLYGNGWQNFAAAAFSNWGAPFDQPGRNGVDENGTIAHPYDRAALNDVFPQYKDARYEYRPYDNLGQFFQTGFVNNTSLNIASKAGKNTSVNVNYAYLDDESFIPNNNLKKHNLGLGVNTKLDNGLQVNTSFNYITSTRNSPPAAPIFSSNPLGNDAQSLFSNVLYTPRSVDLFGLEYENPLDNSSIYYRGGNDIQHPLWTLNNTNDQEKIKRFFGNVQLQYKVTDWLSVLYRLGIDAYTQQQRFAVNKGGRQNTDGILVTSQRLNAITDQVLNLNINHDINDNFNISAIIGANFRRESRDRTFTVSTQQFIYGLQAHNNFINHISSNFSRNEQGEIIGSREENNMGLYANLSLGYRDFLYLNLQARNDWTSTLESANRSVLYPSASVSFLPLDAFEVQSEVLNLLKVRVGYGSSAGYPDPYRTRNVLQTAANLFVTSGGTIINANSISNQFGNPDLRPELHGEVEVGVEGRFFSNRVGLDFTHYNRRSRDLIISRDLDPSTGFTVSTVNTAELSNVGFEVSLNVKPLVLRNFEWSITTNFTRNVNQVVSLVDSVDQILVPGSTGRSDINNFAIPNRPYGTIKGSAIRRDSQGNLMVSVAGQYIQDAAIQELGNPNPDFTMSFINNLTYKFVTFRFQIDWVQGGDLWASTPSTLVGRGILEETGFDRFVPVIAPGVGPDGSENTVQISPNNHYWWHAGVFYDENRIYDGTVVRLREISLSFNAPKSVLSKTPFGRASLTLSGQNLWYKAVSVLDGANYDPEVSSTGVGNGRGFDFVTGPTAKKYGATLSLTF